MPDHDGVCHLLHGSGEGTLDVLKGVVLFLGRRPQPLEEGEHGLGSDMGDGAYGRLGAGVEVEALHLHRHLRKHL